MQVRLSKKQHSQLKLVSEHMGLSMSAIFKEGLGRLFNGEIELPTRAETEFQHTTITLSYQEEQKLKTFADESGISMAELVRVIAIDMIKQLSKIVTQVEALQARKEALTARDEALMARKEALLSAEENDNSNRFHNQKTPPNSPKKH